jgi:FkbM family methyltransferase
MLIYNELNKLVDIKNIEASEQKLAQQYILENDCVLELGARYGSVSCTINKKLKNKLHQVCVEPDSKVWDALEKNKNINKCNFNIVKGFISNNKLSLNYSGYGATSSINNNSKIPSYTLNEIKQTYNINKFNVLVADCEGFLEQFFDENPELYDDIRLIIFEADYPNKCNYKKIKENLKNKGLFKIMEGHQNVWSRDKSLKPLFINISKPIVNIKYALINSIKFRK